MSAAVGGAEIAEGQLRMGKDDVHDGRWGFGTSD